MFGTTRHFLDYFGLKKLDDLPPLADLSDWETLRVQLNLPEVSEDDAEPETAEITDLPVLYPQDHANDDDDLVEDLPDLSSEDDSHEAQVDSAGFEAIPASRWPEPVEILRTLSADGSNDENDETADHQDTDALISRR
jgi:segregation and condensation protein B